MEKKRKEIWNHLEEEYGVPIKDILCGFLFNPYTPLTYADTAAVLNVHRNTLFAWRKDLGIEERPPIRYSLEERFVDKQARKKGYLDIGDAIGDLKLSKGMNVKRMACFLSVSERSIRFYTPEELKR